MSPTHLTTERVLSDRIACVRVLCIVGMIYVHVPGMPEGVARVLDPSSPFASMQAFIVESFGRASAALLSVLSGWLCGLMLVGASIGSPTVRGARPVDKGVALSQIQRRVQSTIVPMIFWASVTMVVYAAVSLVRPTFLAPLGATLVVTLWRYVNTLVFLTEVPHGPTMHLSFLRDLFVCFVLAPVLLMVLRRHALPLVVAIGILYLADGSSALMLRPLLLFAFTLGLWAAVRGVSPTALDGTTGRWAVLTCLSAVGILMANAGHMDGVNRALVVVGLDLRESVLYPLARLFGSLSRLLSRQMPWLFATFCSHFLVLSLLYHGAWLPLTGSVESGPLFFLWFLCAPVVSLAVAYAGLRLVDRWFPGLAPIMGSGFGRRPGGRGSRVPTVALPTSIASTARSVGSRTAPLAPVRAATASARDRALPSRASAKAPV